MGAPVGAHVLDSYELRWHSAFLLPVLLLPALALVLLLAL